MKKMTSPHKQLFGFHNWWSQANFDEQAAEVLDPCFFEFSEFPEVMEDLSPNSPLKNEKRTGSS